jgi:hypothetical protein
MEGEYNVEGGDSQYTTRVNDENENVRTLTSASVEPAIALTAEMGNPGHRPQDRQKHGARRTFVFVALRAGPQCQRYRR